MLQQPEATASSPTTHLKISLNSTSHSSLCIRCPLREFCGPQIPFSCHFFSFYSPERLLYVVFFSFQISAYWSYWAIGYTFWLYQFVFGFWANYWNFVSLNYLQVYQIYFKKKCTSTRSPSPQTLCSINGDILGHGLSRYCTTYS